ncbi:transglycosylase SLT domain-containing protein [Cohnella lubricantis]|uniref:Transglycosylase SLT domain-containing protein n=2 Tax=Cohnella lubricantis TaxID=2163172 RepID=A0A841TFI7_9BACL|nr:transglycosylase SLT domain-containing protein [Cohnella lubricantis]
MRVTTDPRIMKELLLSQIMSGIDPFAQSVQTAQQDGDGDSVFAQLLSQLTAPSLDSLNGSDDNDSLLGLDLNTGAASLQSMLGLSGVSGNAAGLLSREGDTFAYDELIQQAAAQFGVDPALIKGVIQSESSFRSDAVSSAGAKGLMQLMDGTAQGLGVTDSFDPAQNISGGTRYLSYLLRKYDGSEAVALAAYNAGPGTVDKLGIGDDQELASKLSLLPEETQGYVRKVLQARDAWTSPA